MPHRGTNTLTPKWARAKTHTCTGSRAQIQARIHASAFGGTQSHAEVSLQHVGPDSDFWFPPGPAPASGGRKQLPPVPITPPPSQDKPPLLLNQNENYVIPIADAPAADYENEDGRWEAVGDTGTGAGWGGG